ncbi:MAG TPA: nuclear transport factor 2 family protein [Thermoleophilaceae bacterium]|nr:nuclear transport factor 2 family protein [Thermoleophilaceae bacterium]
MRGRFRGVMEGSERIAAVRRIFESGQDYIRGDREEFEAAVAEHCAPDVVVVPSSALASGHIGPFRGHDGVLWQQEAVGRRWADFRLTIDDYVEVPPNIVVLLGRVRARRGDGSGYAVELGIINRFEDGRITSIHSYQSKQRALEEAGAIRLARRPATHHQA